MPRLCFAVAGTALLCAALQATAQGLPDPRKGFFGNFLKAEYLVPIYPLDPLAWGGDLTGTYDQTAVATGDQVELLLLGEYPRARHFSITLYDEHGAIIDTLHDAQIKPFKPSDQNPFVPGSPAGVEDMLYVVRVRLGEGFAESPIPGCGFPDGDTTSNVLDGRLRHTGGSRYSPAQSGFSATLPDGRVIEHDDTTPNKGVYLVVRRYLEDESGGTGAYDRTTPLVYFRNSLNGCAFDLWKLVGQPQPSPGARLPASLWYSFLTAMDLPQVEGHIQHTEDIPASTPYGLDPENKVAWYGGNEYTPIANAQTGYLVAKIPAISRPPDLNAQNRVMRLRMRMPRTPCSERVCALTGDEEVRYWSLSLAEGEHTVVHTISDLDVIADQFGYATVIVTFGTPLPEHVNADNGYSVVQLPVSDAERLTLRNLLSAPSFPCKIENVPFKTNEHHDNGGYLGQYVPTVDFPFANLLPQRALPYVVPNSCGLPPE
jgi:hypothetical protein